jgi:hypothetical protein
MLAQMALGGMISAGCANSGSACGRVRNGAVAANERIRAQFQQEFLRAQRNYERAGLLASGGAAASVLTVF